MLPSPDHDVNSSQCFIKDRHTILYGDFIAVPTTSFENGSKHRLVSGSVCRDAGRFTTWYMQLMALGF